jgi:hypothetical protein
MNQTQTLDDWMDALLEQVAQEKAKCEQSACDLAGIDSQCADACRFDAGALYGFQRVLEAIKTGESVMTTIVSGVDLIAQLNTERSEE